MLVDLVAFLDCKSQVMLSTLQILLLLHVFANLSFLFSVNLFDLGVSVSQFLLHRAKVAIQSTVGFLELGEVFVELLVFSIELLVLSLKFLERSLFVGKLLLLLRVGDLKILDLALFAKVFLFLSLEALHQLTKILTLLREVSLKAGAAVFGGLLLLSQTKDLFLTLRKLLLHSVLGLHELLHSVVLGELETRTEFDGLVKLGNLGFKFLDDLSCLLFLLLSCLDELPGLVNLFFKKTNSTGIFLGELDGGFDSRSVANDDLIQILDLLDQALFRLVGSLEGTVEFLIFGLEALHSLFAHH